MTVFITCNTPTNRQILAGLKAANDPVFDIKAIKKLKTHGKGAVYVGGREIMKPPYYNRLQMTVKALDIPRRQMPDAISIAIARFDGVFLKRDGRLFEVPDIDEVFGSDIWEMRWMSDYLKTEANGTRPATISRCFAKVQLIDLFMRLAHPNVAKHFGK